MSEELKPCPFCGGPAEIWKARENPKLPAWIGCMGKCAVLVTREYLTTEDAIAAWNTRAPVEADAISNAAPFDPTGTTDAEKMCHAAGSSAGYDAALEEAATLLEADGCDYTAQLIRTLKADTHNE